MESMFQKSSVSTFEGDLEFNRDSSFQMSNDRPKNLSEIDDSVNDLTELEDALIPENNSINLSASNHQKPIDPEPLARVDCRVKFAILRSH